MRARKARKTTNATKTIPRGLCLRRVTMAREFTRAAPKGDTPPPAGGADGLRDPSRDPGAAREDPALPRRPRVPARGGVAALGGRALPEVRGGRRRDPRAAEGSAGDGRVGRPPAQGGGGRA